MKQFIHKPQHLKTHRILPGHGNGTRFTNNAPLPGVDREERTSRRHGWTDRQATRRIQHGVSGSVGLVGAALALVVMLFAALGPRANVLDTPEAPTAKAIQAIQAVDATPSPAPRRLKG